MPDWMLKLTRYRVVSGPWSGKVGRGTCSQINRNRVYMWFEQDHPHKNPRNPGGFGSAVSVLSSDVEVIT